MAEQLLIPTSQQLDARIKACEDELHELRRLRRLARAAERAELARRERDKAAVIPLREAPKNAS